MRPSYSPSTLPSSVSKLHYVSYFEQIFNCGSSSCASDDIIEFEQQQDFNISSNDQTSYDADAESDNETYKTTKKTSPQSDESAKEYLNRMRKNLPINNQNIQESPTTASTPTDSKSDKNKNKQQQPHYEMFKVVIPEQHNKHKHRSLKHTDSDSTQSTQSMSDDDDDNMSFDCGESREGIEEIEEQPLMSILRRKQKNGIVVTRNTRHGVRFLASTKFPDPNEIQYRRKKVPRLTSKQKQELILNNYFNNNSTAAVVSVSETILPHLSPKLLIVHTYNNNEFRDYSSSSMSHKDTESRRRLLQKRLERRSQQQQYQYQDEMLQQQQLSMSSSDSSSGFYVFR